MYNLYSGEFGMSGKIIPSGRILLKYDRADDDFFHKLAKHSNSNNIFQEFLRLDVNRFIIQNHINQIHPVLKITSFMEETTNEYLKTALSWGANVNMKCEKHGRTPLHHLLINMERHGVVVHMYNWLDQLKTLARYGATQCKDDYDYYPIHYIRKDVVGYYFSSLCFETFLNAFPLLPLIVPNEYSISNLVKTQLFMNLGEKNKISDYKIVCNIILGDPSVPSNLKESTMNFTHDKDLIMNFNLNLITKIITHVMRKISCLKLIKIWHNKAMLSKSIRDYSPNGVGAKKLFAKYKDNELFTRQN